LATQTVSDESSVPRADDLRSVGEGGDVEQVKNRRSYLENDQERRQISERLHSAARRRSRVSEDKNESTYVGKPGFYRHKVVSNESRLTSWVIHSSSKAWM
jgi:hypothetical protein